MTRSTKFKKLFSGYCNFKKKDMWEVIFVFQGRRLELEQTPDKVFSLLTLHIFHLYSNQLDADLPIAQTYMFPEGEHGT